MSHHTIDSMRQHGGAMARMLAQFTPRHLLDSVRTHCGRLDEAIDRAELEIDQQRIRAEAAEAELRELRKEIGA
jgi:hypothetical protein